MHGYFINLKTAIRKDKSFMSPQLKIIISVLAAAAVFGLLLWKKGTDCLP